MCIALLGHFMKIKSSFETYFWTLKLVVIESKLTHRKILKFKKNPSLAQILILAQGAKFLIVYNERATGKGL